MKNISFCQIAIGLVTACLLAFAPAHTFAQNSGHNDSLVQVTTRLPGHLTPSTVTVAVKNGVAILQGDIILGSIEKLLNPPVQERGLVLQDLDDRWPSGILPYEIDEDFSAAYRDTILAAIQYINGSTNLLLVPRNDDHAYWLDFEPSDVCQSQIGLQGWWGQAIELQDFTTNPSMKGCHFIQIIHEIAHAAGLWHEQCRADRDDYVDIHWDNIIDSDEHNFLKDIDENMEFGAYDFNSCMHYRSRDFAINPAQPTITRKNGSELMGSSADYSSGDVAAINWLYPAKNCALFYTFNLPIPKVNQPLFYQAILSITANTAIAPQNKVTFDAGQAITLQPGFQVMAGSVFRAVIDGCGGQVQPLIVGNTPAGTYAEQLARHAAAERPAENEQNAGLKIGVAPNPCSTVTTVTYTLPEEQPVTMQLFSLTGQLIATPLTPQTQPAGQHEHLLELASFPAGSYLLVVRTGTWTSTQRIVRM